MKRSSPPFACALAAALFVMACSKRSEPTEPAEQAATPKTPPASNTPSGPIAPNTPNTPSAPNTPTPPNENTNPVQPKGSPKGNPKSAPAQWKSVRSDTGKFVIDLPSSATDGKAPTGGLGDLMVQAGGATKGHLVTVFSTKRMGASATVPAAEAVENDAQMPAFKNKTSITLQNCPGVERRSDDGKTVARCYATDTRVYIIIINAPGTALDPAITSRVFDSFKILE